MAEAVAACGARGGDGHAEEEVREEEVQEEVQEKAMRE